MAVVSGRDVLVTLMSDVAELKDNSRSATAQLDKIDGTVDALSGHLAALGDLVAALGDHVTELARIQRDNTKRFERVGKTLVKLSDLLGDHEDRITALEARS